MTSNDIVLRGGLFISVLVLAGLFAGHLMTIKEDREEDEFDNAAEELSSIFSTMANADRGSSLTLNIGDKDGNGLSFSGSVGGETMEIRFLPGAVYMISGNDRRNLLTDSRIVPAHPTMGADLTTTNMARNISRAAGGFSIMAPASVTMEVSALDSGEVLFIYTTDTPPEDLCEIERFMNETFMPGKDWERSVTLKCRNGISYHHAGFLMFFRNRDNGSSCPFVYLLPPTISVMDRSGSMDPSKITIDRCSVEWGEAFVHEISITVQ